MMKKIFTVAAGLILLCLSASGQTKIMTRKLDIGDVSSKITKVVLTGNDAVTNLAIKEEIERNWIISPYEFCSLEEFDRLKCDTNYFFLLKTIGQYKKEAEPSVEFLSLLRGGPDAEKGLDKMLEVISLPLRALSDESGRYFTFIPAFINIIQEHIPVVTKSDISAYTGIYTYTDKINGSGDMEVLFCDTDLSADVRTGKAADRYFKEGMQITDAETIDEALAEMRPNTLVSYTVAAKDGRFCFKMLVSSEDYSLYFYRKHRMSRRLGPGFLLEDIKRVALPR